MVKKAKREDGLKTDRRRKKTLRNFICATWSILELALVVLGFQGLGWLIQRIDVDTESMEAVLSDAIVEDVPMEESELVVCLDAGHGGKDNGADYQGRYEKDDNLRIAQAVAAYLREKGVAVVMTREEDVFLSLEERCRYANESQADYFVSLHRNTGDGNGVETWVYSGASDETTVLAERIQEKLNAAGVQRNRGVKKGTQSSESGNYYVNIHSDMPSCIVELGFMGDSKDNQLFDEKLDAYAAAIGDALLETYEVYGDAAIWDVEGSTESGEAPAEVEDDMTPTQKAIEVINAVETTTQMINTQGLSTSIVDWGLGRHMDDKNRPNDALVAQKQYGAYNAMFIGEDSQTIYLTFDEGYEYGYTESILDTLKEKNVQAVFFVTEPYAKSEPELVQRMIDEGHVVGNHSVTHPSAGIPSLSIEEQQEEILGNHQYIKDNFGYEMDLFRYPAGKFSEQSLAVINNCGYKSIFWSFAYMDYDVENQPDEEESLARMTERLHPGAVYLLHAESKTNAAVLGDFIDAAKSQGYCFETI